MTNAEAVARSLAAVWHPCTQMKAHERFPLVPIRSAEGAWLHDFEGRRYLDGVSSWWVNLLGHGHPEVAAAIQDQLGRLSHVMLAGFTHEPVIELSERLARLAPGKLGHAFFASDGASATEIALKMAFHYWANRGLRGKNRFVALEGGYHGETVGALAVTDVAIFRDAYAPLLRENLQVPFPTAPGAIDALEALLSSRHAEIAALIVEPLVQGASGMRMYPPEYLARARELCTKYHVLLIADEIMAGFGRTGTLFAFEQAGPGVAPDLMCLSKGITGGFLPLSCVLCTDEVYAAFYDDDVSRGFLHSHSYTGNALACRAACAVLQVLERDSVIAANREKAALFSKAAAVLATQRSVHDFRHLGMIWAFEVHTKAPDFARRAFERALALGVLLRPIGNTVYFMPPYCVDGAQFNLLVDAGLAIATELGEVP
ncbi:adenosylmethionine--8-amino-7-oxononanoate transaminase [Betaproteobacteria bacterium GR16-43]|nr:adenosylmethionine--8-amino-7-oxononanoate transaminase [Betaproteobacteria bacterium GR16-43]